MTAPVLSNDERALLARRIQRFMAEDLDTDIGNMDAERLIEFLTPSLGARFYNIGLRDAQALFARKADDINDEIYALERPVDDRE